MARPASAPTTAPAIVPPFVPPELGAAVDDWVELLPEPDPAVVGTLVVANTADNAAVLNRAV